MKKSIVAGAASLVLAAMPVVGVFAADPAALVDTLTVTVNESCTFTRTTGNGQYTQSMTAGALNAVFTSLAHKGNAGQAITYAAVAPTAGSGTWTASVSSSPIAASNGKLGEQSTQDPSGGRTYTVEYAVSLHDDQAQGTYEGTATYTLVQKTGA